MDTRPHDLPLGRGVEVLVRDARGLIALAKPAGVLSHPNDRGEEDRSLLQAPYDLKEQAFVWPGGRLWLLNRLDSGTSGVILAAGSAALAGEIRTLFLGRGVRKTYAALVFGTPSQAREVWRDRLTVEKKAGRIRTGTGGHIPSEAGMEVLWQDRVASPPLALLRLEPRTGRSHQLRVQCANRGLPIVGDATYGDFGANRRFAKATGDKRLFLHSWKTEFRYRFAGGEHRFVAEAPLPPAFERLRPPH
jgi:tRNA pseudouridine65 synthase